MEFPILASIFLVALSFAVWKNQYVFALVPFGLLLFYEGWQNRKFLFYLLLFSLPFSIEYHFSASLGMDLPDELLMLLVSFVFFAAWLFSPGALQRSALTHPLTVLLISLWLWSLVSCLFSTVPLLSWKFLAAKTWYLGAFVLAPLMLLGQKKNLVIAVTALLIAMTLVVLIVIYRQYQNGFQFGKINEAVSPFFRNHVNYSAMLVTLFPVLVAAYFLHRSKLRWLLAITIPLFLFAIVFSYSRGAWVALIGESIAFLLIRKKWLPGGFVVLVLATLLAFSWLKQNDRYLQFSPDFKTTVFHKDFGQHLVATYKLRDVSTAERFYRWIAAVRMIKDNWLTGYGPNSFYENYKGYAVPAFKTWVSDNRDRSTVHNYFLLTAVEQGLPGLLILLILFGALFYFAQAQYRRAKNKFNKAVAMTVGLMGVAILILNFLSDLVETDKVGSLFFLCISVLVVNDERVNGE